MELARETGGRYSYSKTPPVTPRPSQCMQARIQQRMKIINIQTCKVALQLAALPTLLAAAAGEWLG